MNLLVLYNQKKDKYQNYKSMKNAYKICKQKMPHNDNVNTDDNDVKLDVYIER